MLFILFLFSFQLPDEILAVVLTMAADANLSRALQYCAVCRHWNDLIGSGGLHSAMRELSSPLENGTFTFFHSDHKKI